MTCLALLIVKLAIYSLDGPGTVWGIVLWAIDMVLIQGGIRARLPDPTRGRKFSHTNEAAPVDCGRISCWGDGVCDWGTIWGDAWMGRLSVRGLWDAKVIRVKSRRNRC
jgi:hypothetical protein